MSAWLFTLNTPWSLKLRKTGIKLTRNSLKSVTVGSTRTLSRFYESVVRSDSGERSMQDIFGNHEKASTYQMNDEFTHELNTENRPLLRLSRISDLSS